MAQASDWDDLVPLQELSQREAIVLGELLAGSTGTPDRCWFALWEGYGSLGPAYEVSDTVPGPAGRPTVTPEARSKGQAVDEAINSYPRVRTLWSRSEPSFATREYLLFRGPIEALPAFHFGVWWQPPNLCWPNDRSWCVATEVDGYDTFVWGSRRWIDTVLACLDLEALPVHPDDRFGPVDPLNPAPWDP